jgi:peptide chain release factor 2
MSTIELLARLNAVEPALAITTKRSARDELRAKVQSAGLWDDPEVAARLMGELSRLEGVIKQWDDLQELLGMEELEDADVAQLEKDVIALEQQALLSALNDASGALITIHAGTGGVDAQDWAEMLERMFLRFIESGSTEAPENRVLSIDRNDWKANIVDVTRGEEAGIKRAEIEVSGSYAFGLLKAEAGVHRLVRISPFGAKGLRQTSFALVEVIPEVDQNIDIQIDEKDLRIDVYRSGGHGGQGVNTTDSAVRITHLPTNLVVTVQNERSQRQNKATAMTILTSRLARIKEMQNAEETAMLKGEFKEGSWGNQIRSYVLQPYQLVKDHRTGQETANVQKVLDGDIADFIKAYLIN